MSDDLPDPSGLGGGRRRTLEAAKQKDSLGTIDAPENLEELVEAVEEISLDAPRYMTPPEEVIETIQNVYEMLPEEARSHYVSDDVMVRRVNAARKQFDKWIGRLIRKKQIPSLVEAGPSKYPHKKARKTSRYEREAKEELNERISDIKSAARGGRQRALNAIGTSIAERNEEKAQSERELMASVLESGDIVRFRNPNWTLGEVVRVNKKTVTVRYPNPLAGAEKVFGDGVEPDFLETRVDLDDDWLAKLTQEILDDTDTGYETVEEVRSDKFGGEN